MVMTENVFRNEYCECCGSRSDNEQLGVFSSFLAKRALGAPPFPVKIYRCTICGFRWSERGLSPEEASRLYSGYSGDAYFMERHGFEPWYSREFNDGIGAEKQMAIRRSVCLEALSTVTELSAIQRVVDFGGDRGQMLVPFDGAEKFVYDISGVKLEPGVKELRDPSQHAGSFDLALNCHVLEHVNAPRHFLLEVLSLVQPGGVVFLEVPDETYRGPFSIGFELGYIQRLCNSPRALKLVDFVSTACRVKLRLLPPLCFVAIREHINYFTLDALCFLMKTCGLDILHRRTVLGNHVALGRKP